MIAQYYANKVSYARLMRIENSSMAWNSIIKGTCNTFVNEWGQFLLQIGQLRLKIDN